MPAPDSPQVLIGRYLQSNGFTKTLAAFLEETNLTTDNLTVSSDLTLEKVLDERRLYELSLKLEKTEIVEKEKDPGFSVPYPSIPTEITPAEIKPANILSVTIVPALEPFSGPILISTAADRSLRIFSATPPYVLLRHFPAPSDSAVLSVAVVEEKHLLISTMTGRISLLSPATGEILASIRPHEKYAIRVLYHKPYVISAAYDKTICVHTLCEGRFSEEEPLGKLSLPTPPEALAVVSLPDNKGDAVVFARRDSTKLYYHLLTPGLPAHSVRDLAPNAYLVHHAMSISPSPCDPSLLAIATSAVPHMKVLLVRVDSDDVLAEWFTGAPQSAYSTAVVRWRPDGSGVWINADEGVVRGVEVKSGKVRARLVVGSGTEKVRTLWAGVVEGVGECLVTGGFDKGLRVWRIEEGKGEDGVGKDGVAV